jgi:pimeloyl-ACP methyl ester carboxylesterase
MGRRSKIAVAVALGVVALLVVNALIADGKTDEAEVTVPGGRILELPQGDLQAVESGPRDGDPIVLIHCYTCSLDWWDGVVPSLERDHRVVRLDLLGHGGSEKPGSGYAPEEQAEVVAEALERLEVTGATVVGHSLGGTITVALAERDPQLVERAAIVDMPPDDTYGDLGLPAELVFYPLIGEALWAVKPDASVRDGLQKAFAPGFEVPDAYVEGVKRMTYTAYDDTIDGQESFLDEGSLDQRLKRIGKPLMVLMGAEEQLVDDPRRALDQYKQAVPAAEIHLVADAGHSPNVEQPEKTAALVLGFARSGEKQVGSSVRDVTERGPEPQRSSRRDVP